MIKGHVVFLITFFFFLQFCIRYQFICERTYKSRCHVVGYWTQLCYNQFSFGLCTGNNYIIFFSCIFMFSMLFRSILTDVQNYLINTPICCWFSLQERKETSKLFSFHYFTYLFNLILLSFCFFKVLMAMRFWFLQCTAMNETFNNATRHVEQLSGEVKTEAARMTDIDEEVLVY